MKRRWLCLVGGVLLCGNAKAQNNAVFAVGPTTGDSDPKGAKDDKKATQDESDKTQTNKLPHDDDETASGVFGGLSTTLGMGWGGVTQTGQGGGLALGWYTSLRYTRYVGAPLVILAAKDPETVTSVMTGIHLGRVVFFDGLVGSIGGLPDLRKGITMGYDLGVGASVGAELGLSRYWAVTPIGFGIKSFGDQGDLLMVAVGITLRVPRSGEWDYDRDTWRRGDDTKNAIGSPCQVDMHCASDRCVDGACAKKEVIAPKITNTGESHIGATSAPVRSGTR